MALRQRRRAAADARSLRLRWWGCYVPVPYLSLSLSFRDETRFSLRFNIRFFPRFIWRFVALTTAAFAPFSETFGVGVALLTKRLLFLEGAVGLGRQGAMIKPSV